MDPIMWSIWSLRQVPGMNYSRLQKVGTWIEDDLWWLSSFLWFGVGGQACSNFLASTVWATSGYNEWSRIMSRFLKYQMKHKFGVIYQFLLQSQYGI